MTVAIKIKERKKQKIDHFVASLLVQEDLKITAQEAIGLMIDYAIENKEDIIKKIKQQPSLEDDSVFKMLDNPKHWGIKDSSAKIDESLYGR